MTEVFRIGPARVLVADSVTDPIEDWVDIGVTRGDVRFAPEGGRYSMGRADQKGRTPIADSVYDLGFKGRVTAPLLDHDIDKMVEWFPSSVKNTNSSKDALGMGSGTARVTPKAIALVPVDEYTAGSPWWTSEFTVWLPKAIAVVVGPYRNTLPDGDDALAESVLEVEFMGVTGDATLPASVRDGAMGPAWVLGAGVLGLDFLWRPEDGLTPLVGGTTGVLARASIATYRDSNGDLQSAASGEFRNSHYIGTTRTALIEPQRTNIALRSEDFTATWSVGDVTVTADDATAPDGAATADLLVADATTATHYVAQALTLTADGDYALSVFVKAAGYDYIGLMLHEVADTSNRAAVVFNVATGAVERADDSNGTGAVNGYSIIDYGSFYRIVLRGSVGNGATAIAGRVYLQETPSTPFAAFLGDGASGAHVWGAQAEDAAVETSYIATAGSTVTRLADVLYFPLPAVVSTPQQKSLYIRFRDLVGGFISGLNRILHIGAAGTTTPRLDVLWVSGNDVQVYHDNGSANVTSDSSGGLGGTHGDQVDLLATTGADGSVSGALSVNSGAEEAFGASSPNAFGSAYADTRLYVGLYNGNHNVMAVEEIQLGRNTRTLSQHQGISA